MSIQSVLIVCASGYGSTAEVAEKIADTLRVQGILVEVQSADTARSPRADEAVMIGSTIRYDRWLPEAVNYVDKHQDMLKTLPVAYFYCCLKLAAAESPATEIEQPYDTKLLKMNPNISPIMVGGFAGKLNYKPMPWYFRLVLGAIVMRRGLKEGDYRDWKVIQEWANQFAHCLSMNYNKSQKLKSETQ